MPTRSPFLNPRWLPAVAAALCALGSARVWAQGEPSPSREEQWRRMRLEKRARLRSERPGLLERSLLALEKAERPSILDFNLGGFYPRAEAIGWGSKQAFGARFWKPDIGGSPLDAHASALFSVRRYAFGDLQVGLLPHLGRRLPARSTKGDDFYELGEIRHARGRRALAYASFRYRHLPELRFYGLGGASREQDRTTFLLRDTAYELVAGYQHSRRAVFTVRGGLLHPSVAAGRDERFPVTQDLFDDASAPGLLNQPDFLHLTGQLLLDGRDEPGNPHRGAMLAVSLAHYDDQGGRAFRFQRLGVDARAFLPLGSPQRVLALRAFTSLDDPAEGSRVPFYLQETLGGSHTLRGFQSFRFRGEKMITLQAEYRWEAAPAVELALLFDAGKVFSRSSDFDLRGMETDVGLGLRIKTYDAVLVRLDVARSREQTRALLRLSPSF